MEQVDVLHLSFRPPFAPGSYNRLVGMQLERLKGFRQAAISYWDEPPPEQLNTDEILLVNRQHLSLFQHLHLRLPEAWRPRQYNGVMGQEGLIYYWGILRLLPRLRPKVIVCYDNYKFGALLRQAVNWPCRLVLNQQGLSYHLAPMAAAKLYSLHAFDVVWTSTLSSYRFDRYRQTAYESQVTVIPNWIDMDKFAPAADETKRQARARWQLPPDKQIVLWLSRLVPKKGAHLILSDWPAILRQHPNAFLWIVGGTQPGGEYDRYLRQLIKTLGVEDSVRLQGAAPPEVTQTCYQAADIYLFPTVFSGEGFGLSLLEGLASGLACVASDHQILQELYPAEVVRLVSDPNLIGAFVEPVSALLADAGLRQQMGQAGRAFAVQHYHHDKVLAQVKDFYLQQLNLAKDFS
jgi:glycosyltransferase involved in cell wall biosynthesis